jgi:3-hydroxybutyryl-CoA dehydrogenase
MNFSTVGVIGVGNIGSGVVVDLLLHGIHAVGVDLSQAELARAQKEIVQAVRFAPMLAKGSPRLTAEETLARITLTTDLEQVARCQFIVENITEDWSVKEPLYHRLEEIAPPGVYFGANTSCIPIGRIAGATRRPDKVVGMHFMNPVYLKPTVEVIRGKATSEATLGAVNDLFGQLKKKAIVVGDMPGFVSNRISHLFMNEAAWVFQDGLATAAQIDGIFKQCFGHKMGPLETADLIGLDTVMRSLDVLFDAFQDQKFRCCPLLRQMVAAGKCGVKSGRGFYVYPQS